MRKLTVAIIITTLLIFITIGYILIQFGKKNNGIIGIGNFYMITSISGIIAILVYMYRCC